MMPQQNVDISQSPTCKLAKPAKVRRTRQPRNPQLSVARRNERERNRVKMVNNGFALLREHLPVEDLQVSSSGERSGSETPTTDGGRSSAAGKAKKFSKVETLRAAIKRIKMLEELIRSTDPAFESMNIRSSGEVDALSGYDVELEEEPLDWQQPASQQHLHQDWYAQQVEASQASQHQSQHLDAHQSQHLSQHPNQQYNQMIAHHSPSPQQYNQMIPHHQTPSPHQHQQLLMHQSPSSQQSLHLESPVWFGNSPDAQHQHQQPMPAQAQQMQIFANQHHQISLYSQ